MIGFPAAKWAAGLVIYVAGPLTGQTYYQLHYDYEVAAQCGLVSPALEAAFRKKRARQDQDKSISTEARRQLRLKAYVAAAKEYDNRGLGGFKQWCNEEARQGAGRILTSTN